MEKRLIMGGKEKKKREGLCGVVGEGIEFFFCSLSNLLLYQSILIVKIYRICRDDRGKTELERRLDILSVKLLA